MSLLQIKMSCSNALMARVMFDRTYMGGEKIYFFIELANNQILCISIMHKVTNDCLKYVSKIKMIIKQTMQI
jgi:hypothetical protein